MQEISTVLDGSTLEGRIDRYGDIRRSLDAADAVPQVFKDLVDHYVEGFILAVYGLLHNPQFNEMPLTAHLFTDMPSGAAFAAGRDWVLSAYRAHGLTPIGAVSVSAVPLTAPEVVPDAG